MEKREPRCEDNQILACTQATGWTFPNGNYAFANTGPLELPWLGSVSQDQRSVMCWLFVCPPSPVWGNHGFCCRCIGNTIDGELPWWPYSSNQAMSSVSGTAQPGRHNSRALSHQAERHWQARTEWLVGSPRVHLFGGWRRGRNDDLGGPAETMCALIQDSAVSILRSQRPQSTQMSSGSVTVEALGLKGWSWHWGQRQKHVNKAGTRL